ncbi:MAG: hypothetical protein IPM86_07160 [Saprospiraceae bacterium]|nr:hypothetical protein [Saprospiraceae bacterium]
MIKPSDLAKGKKEMRMVADKKFFLSEIKTDQEKIGMQKKVLSTQTNQNRLA